MKWEQPEEHGVWAEARIRDERQADQHSAGTNTTESGTTKRHRLRTPRSPRSRRRAGARWSSRTDQLHSGGSSSLRLHRSCTVVRRHPAATDRLTGLHAVVAAPPAARERWTMLDVSRSGKDTQHCGASHLTFAAAAGVARSAPATIFSPTANAPRCTRRYGRWDLGSVATCLMLTAASALLARRRGQPPPLAPSP